MNAPLRTPAVNQSAAHTALVKQILLALGSRADLLLWQNTTGKLRAPTSERRIEVGLPGSPDIIGILGREVGGQIVGVFLGLEVKTGAADQSPQQRRFAAAATRCGSAVYVVRSVDDAIAAVQRAGACQ